MFKILYSTSNKRENENVTIQQLKSKNNPKVDEQILLKEMD